jgi:hypothetical protein
LATQIERTQNVVEDRVKTERRRRAAAALTQVRQDKLLELLVTQLCENALPWLAFRHIERQSDGILHSSLVSEATLARCAFERKYSAEKTCNQLRAKCDQC